MKVRGERAQGMHGHTHMSTLTINESGKINKKAKTAKKKKKKKKKTQTICDKTHVQLSHDASKRRQQNVPNHHLEDEEGGRGGTGKADDVGGKGKSATTVTFQHSPTVQKNMLTKSPNKNTMSGWASELCSAQEGDGIRGGGGGW